MAEFDSELYFRVALISLLLSLASGDCIDLDLGMENGTILDSVITASSDQSASTPAKNGRLNYTSGSSWCAGTSDSNPYLQIDLQTLHIICAVSTQGNSQADQWVTNYTLKLSRDGSTWTDYKEDGLVKTLEGSNDRNSEVKHAVYGVVTRYLRFMPKTHFGGVCMRTEVFGVKTKPENLALGKPTAQASTYNYNSTVTGVSRNAVDGNSDTDFQNGHCSHTNAANPSWWRVDLGANLVPVSEIFIVNRFSSSSSLVQQRNEDYKITLGSSSDVTKNDVCEGLYSFVDFKASAVCFINPLITGRYVGIMTTKTQILQLCEVEVYSRENLAFGKPTFQFRWTYKDGKSSKAVDGNSNTHFQYGKPEGSCTMTVRTTQVAPWWRVDLQQVEHVSEVYIVNRGSECNCPDRFKNFEIRVGMVSNGQSSANPKCGDTYTYQFPVGEGRSFFCHPSLKGRYVIIRFLDKDKPLALCEVEVYSERRACPMQAIGVASSDAFPDNRFSASSTSGSNKAFKGRLNGNGAWLPSDNNDAYDYLQIDLVYEFVICAVATQGHPTSNDWTTKYKLQLALIDLTNNWLTYQENSKDKVFNGNSGKNDIVKHSLKEYASARFIRFQPTTYKNNKALRVEVFGILVSAVPSHGPENVSSTEVNYTTFEITWAALSEKVAHGVIQMYQVRLFLKENCTSAQSELYSRFNTTTTNMVLSGLSICAKYEVSIRGYTAVGPGPYSRAIILQTLGVKWSKTTPSPPSFPSNSTEAGFTAKITLPRFPTNAKFFQVIIITVSSHYAGVVNSPRSFTPQDLVTYDEAHESLVPAAYVTFQFSGNDFDNYQEFIVGNGAKSNSKTRRKRSCDDSEQYYNKPLQPNTNYRVFLRAFVTEMLYISSNFEEIKTKEKPAVKPLAEKSILSVGELVLLTCEVTGDPEPLVTWTKNGNTSIPRAQFKNDGRILVIKDIVPLDSGVYECKASNKFGESRTSTTVIVAVPPRIAKEVSPSSVICERQTLCTFSCYATSGSPFNYSWTKNGQVPVSDDIKIMKNSIVLTPRDAEDYGLYVCHVTNRFGSTTYKITLLECQRSSKAVDTIKGDDSGNSVLYATVITFSCIVFVLLVVIGVLIWRLRRSLPENRATAAGKSITDNADQSVSPRDQHMPERGSYMELSPRPLEGQSPAPSAYQSLQGKDENDEYYNVRFNDGKDEQNEIYHEIGNVQC